MTSVGDAIFYILVFLSVYVQIFFLVTFFENRKNIIIRKGKIELRSYPTVTVAVPCFNEKKTVETTVQSLLALNYPQNRLEIFIVDDGSTDDTWNTISKFQNYRNVKIFHKENGGKHTALNLALDNLETEFFGCLDADSIADPESLVRLMSYFEKDPTIMAVAPSILAVNSKKLIQKAQKAEYEMTTVYLKRMLGFLGGINVAPGPLTVFRRKVFDDLGPYKQAHNSEDMEIAYRMQKHHYRIEQCNDAYVYTNTPSTIAKLFKQRVRWAYGFMNNTIDYRSILFRKKYGNFSLFTIPSALVAIFSSSYLLGKMIYILAKFLYSRYVQFSAVGFNFKTAHSVLDPFFINTQSLVFIIPLVYLSVIFSIMLGKRMSEGKWSFSVNIIYFLLIFSVTSPFYLVTGIYNTVLQRKPSWR